MDRQLQTNMAQRGLSQRLAPLLQEMERQGRTLFMAIGLTGEDDRQDPPDVGVLLAQEGVLGAKSDPPSSEGPQVRRVWSPRMVAVQLRRRRHGLEHHPPGGGQGSTPTTSGCRRARSAQVADDTLGDWRGEQRKRREARSLAPRP